MRYIPRNKYLTVKPAEMEVGSTEGGLFLPDSAKEHSQTGTVLAVGDGVINKKGERVPLKVKAGDNILFHRNSGFHLVVDEATDEQILLLEESDVLATI